MVLALATEIVDHLIDAYDIDKDGQLSKKEAKAMFVDIYRSQGDKLNKKEIQRFMRLIDVDKNHKLDRPKLRRLFSMH